MGGTTFERGTWQKLKKVGAAQLIKHWLGKFHYWDSNRSERIKISNLTEEENALIKSPLLTDWKKRGRECFWLLLLPIFPLVSAHVSSCWFGVLSITVIAVFLKLESKWEISRPCPNLISCATMQRQPKRPLRSVRKTFPILLFRGFLTFLSCSASMLAASTVCILWSLSLALPSVNGQLRISCPHPVHWGL